MSSLHNQLKDGLLKSVVPEEFCELAATYGQSLLQINEKLNLTGAKTPEDLVSKHLLDTYLASQAMSNRSWPHEIWDIGSGGGIPGIPLAIFKPQLRVHLIERRQKKATALSQLVADCALNSRVRVSSGAFESFKPIPQGIELWFRGFLPGVKLIQYLSDHFRLGDLGTIILMKGPAWDVEKTQALDLKRISPYWRQRFLDSEKIHYELPEGLGTRVIVKL